MSSYNINIRRGSIKGVLESTMRMRTSSVASAASSIMRHSASYTDLSGLIEEPGRQVYPTAMIPKSKIRAPMAMQEQVICHEALDWAMSDLDNQLSSSARIIKNFKALGEHTATMLVDEEEKMVAGPGDDVYLFLQIVNVDVSGFPSSTVQSFIPINTRMDLEIFYTVTFQDGRIYQSKVWNVNDRPSQVVEPFLLPFSPNVFVSMYGRIPITQPPKKKSLFSIKKRNPSDLLMGCDLKLGSCEMHLHPVDHGKDVITMTLETDVLLDEAIRILNPNPNYGGQINKHRIDLRVGVWTGAGPRFRNLNEAAHESYITLQSNPKCPVWRRYWAQVQPEEGVLNLYDFEYKTSKLHHVIKLDRVQEVRPADSEEYPIPNTFVMMLESTSTSPICETLREGILSDSQLDVWASSQTLVSVEPSVWVCRSDNELEMDQWMRSLAAAARYVRSQNAKVSLMRSKQK